MGLALNQVHPYTVKAGRAIMGKPNPALRIKTRIQLGRDERGNLMFEDCPPIWIQGGRAYGEGGDHIPLDDLPEWFWEYVSDPKKVSPAQLDEVGWKAKRPRKAKNGDGT